MKGKPCKSDSWLRKREKEVDRVEKRRNRKTSEKRILRRKEKGTKMGKRKTKRLKKHKKEWTGEVWTRISKPESRITFWYRFPILVDLLYRGMSLLKILPRIKCHTPSLHITWVTISNWQLKKTFAHTSYCYRFYILQKRYLEDRCIDLDDLLTHIIIEI